MVLNRLLPFLLLSGGMGMLGIGVATPQPAAPKKVSFSKEILPILAENCFLCHGPDISTRVADIQLQDRDHTIADRDGYQIIKPGDAENSELIKRINDSDLPMPPADTGKVLTPEQKALLAQWIDEGAEYDTHWAFKKLPSSIQVPTAGGEWSRDDLDRFIAEKHNETGLNPSREAEPLRWLRRVTFDLTGLPPTLSEIEEFEESLDYEATVDRLLAKRAFGERMASPWLDAARYADSYGYQSDLLTPQWPYRDWVIDAFNKNLPYDQFLTWQLAGDLLPDSTREQKLATAFNRLHRMSNEGGSIAEEFKIEYAADRVATFGTSVLGLTLECARCHDHKYDPISQKEFYEFFAFFNEIDEYGLLLSTGIVPTPSLLLPNEEQEATLEKAERADRAAAENLTKALAIDSSKFEDWLGGDLKAEIKGVEGSYDFDNLVDNKFPNSIEGKPSAEPFTGPAIVNGRSGKGLQLDGESGLTFPGLSSPNRHTPFTWSIWIKDTLSRQEDSVLLHRTGGTDVGFCGFDLTISEGILTARLMRHWPGNALSIRTVEPLSKDEWEHVVWSWDGTGRVDGLKIYVNGEPAKTEVVADKIWKTVNAYGNLGPGGASWVVGQRFRAFGFKGGVIDDFQHLNRAVSDLEAKHLYDGKAFDQALAAPIVHAVALAQHYTRTADPEVKAALEAVRKTQQELVAAENPIHEVMVMDRPSDPTPAYLLDRGAYDAPKNEETRVFPSVPATFNLPLEGEDVSRLDLAEWVTHPDHPLTARVAVNRIWQMMFGAGLVETSENFGLQGSQPTHPELLDYLAREFVSSGWDTKAMIRRIALSATYRQDSALTEELKQQDPENLLLARGPAFRLSAEMIRDLALSSSGLMKEKDGGPPVRPYQPPGLWREVNGFSPAYVESKGDDLYRRSLYTVWKRTAPAPNMMAFDTTSREFCSVKRARTNTPLQALVLLNDPQFVEASRVLAEAEMAANSDDEKRLASAFLKLSGRRPDDREMSILEQALEEQRAEFKAQPELAEKLIKLGASPADSSIDKIELASLTVAVQLIMNMDGVIWRR